MGTNIPNKPREPLIWLGGVPEYYKMLTKSAAGGYNGFKLSWLHGHISPYREHLVYVARNSSR